MESPIDTTKPHVARMYDYFLGGKDHFAVDRETAERLLRIAPTARTSARENRAFLARAVRYLVTEAGIRQFLDIGAGLPSANNVHEVAQAIAPESRVVYVDNDPIVLAHARALLKSSSEGRTAYIDADVREPQQVLADPVLAATLDLSRPVALMLLGILYFLPDSDAPRRMITTFLDALPSGSYLAASHMTIEHVDPGQGTAGMQVYHQGGIPLQTRTADEFAELAFSGLELVDPGVVLVSDWRPSTQGPRPLAAEVSMYGGVARKP